MRSRILTLMCCFAAFAFLTACNSSGGKGPVKPMTPMTPGDPMDPGDNGRDTATVGEKLSAGETLAARHVAGMKYDNSNDTMQPDDWDDFSVKRRADGELTITVDGTEYARSPPPKELLKGGDIKQTLSKEMNATRFWFPGPLI